MCIRDRESGATLDLISVDLYTGTARIFKAGAAPGFLVHGGRARPVGDISLPIGILGSVNGQSRVVHLAAGDYAVLVSDGLLVDGPGWVAKPVSYTHLHPDHTLYEKYFPNGGASIFTFNIKGGREEAFKFIDNLKIFSLLANVADVKSLVIHPASTTHSQLNDQELAEQQIYQNTIRLSIGTEHIDDIIADLEAGFAAVRGE